MSDRATVPKPSAGYPVVGDLARKVPTQEELYLTPVRLVSTLSEIAPKIVKTGAWWALTGDLGENLLDVHVRPTEIEILADAENVSKIRDALCEYEPSPISPMEKKLEREAEPDEKTYPVFVRGSATECVIKGTRVIIIGDYAMKVGEWEWGDPLVFEQTFVNVAGVQIPVMPLRLRSEFYIMLGWMDRAQLISESTQRAHAFMQQFLAESS